jgi:glycosyltransferase involved in cell wall biosynthesis
LLTNLDVILARHYLSGPASGRYGAAATAAQVALFAPGAVAALAFERFSRSRETRVVRLFLARGVLVVAILGAVAAVTVSVWATPFVTAIFGGLYPQAGAVVGMLTVGGAIFGVVIVLLYFQVAGDVRYPSRLTWGGVVLLVGLTAFRHATMGQIAQNLLIASSVVGVTMVTVALGSDRPVDDDVVDQANLALLDADLDLTIVVPYYNPGELLASNLRRLVEVLSHSESSFEVIAVSDGSTDGSDRSIDDIDDPRLLRVVLPHNMGKGAALRVGFAQGRGKWLGFIDADGDLDPHLLEPFQVLTHLYDPEIILGSKRHPLSEIEYPKIRRIYSWTYYHLIHVLFSLNVQDTQTGIKLVRRDVLAAVLPRMVEKRFAFDLELFVIARRLGYRRFLEAPIRLKYQFTSTVSWRSVRQTLRDTLSIFVRLRLLHWYDSPLPPASVQDLRRLQPIILRGSTISESWSPKKNTSAGSTS